MPQIKKKKVQDDSDSSDTSLNSDDDTKKQPAKKAKTDTKPSKSSSSSGDSGENFFDIGKNKRVTVREFKNKLYVDIREFYMDKNSGDMKPGKKGVSLTVDAWRKLNDLVPEIDEAIKAMA